MKNRYVGRTFIMPAQGLRKKSVRQKLSPIASEFAGRNVLLVDDSIVRGTTSSQIINMAREAGAKRVYMASAAPPVRYPNVYGIDMPTSAELLASRYSDEQMDEMAREIGADRIFYQAPPPGRPVPPPEPPSLKRAPPARRSWTTSAPPSWRRRPRRAAPSAASTAPASTASTSRSTSARRTCSR